MTLHDFDEAIRPKVHGSWNLHTLLPKGMEFFVLLSSSMGIIGSRGQANYASANTYQDGLALFRSSHGEKAIAIDLGMVTQVGYVASRQNVQKALERDGLAEITEAELHAMLDYYCDPNLPLQSPMDSQLVVGLKTSSVTRARGSEDYYWIDRPLFRNLLSMTVVDKTDQGRDNERMVDYGAQLLAAKSAVEASTVVCDAMVRKLSKVLDIPSTNIDVAKPMHLYGVDSLVAVEVRSWFNKSINADVAIFEIMGNQSIASLASLVARKSQYLPASLKEPEE